MDKSEQAKYLLDLIAKHRESEPARTEHVFDDEGKILRSEFYNYDGVPLRTEMRNQMSECRIWMLEGLRKYNNAI